VERKKEKGRETAIFSRAGNMQKYNAHHQSSSNKKIWLGPSETYEMYESNSKIAAPSPAPIFVRTDYDDERFTMKRPEPVRRAIPISAIIAISIGIPVIVIVAIFVAVWLQELGILSL